ncbi:malonyl-[acyl-carrier protein] O-methyltransferase [Paenibacillus tyrfis]|uniref:malonyl-ACP O-methyltransferase BioC n=1 Tax=Paenibacillus tyrfis TaxID=1501230 RepID=UPI00248F97A4|nr:malonyl-ACP O-methyltransferase BioC [Paenibacillus tyrfis]GLI08558.1 malonyl-[acyl-carrier protein] O-methyltransferase [Paenibacillus tyrfis]
MEHRLHSIRRRFDRSARASYDAHARVQRVMADKLGRSLARWKQGVGETQPHLLEIGCGTGLLTEILLRDWPDALITALDIAPVMLKAAERRIRTKASSVAASQRLPVSFHLADAEAWAAQAEPLSFDLIVSSACFQWLGRPHETLRHLRRLLRPGGLMAFTTFGPETFRELHESFAAVYRSRGLEPQRHGLPFLSAGEWRNLLQHAGFADVREESAIRTEGYASVSEFLHSVKATGASASAADAPRGLGWRSLFAGMFREYEKRFPAPEGIAATYELLFLQAEVPS